MTPELVKAVALMAGMISISLFIGWCFGRFGERNRIVSGLWFKDVRADVIHWIARGGHREPRLRVRGSGTPCQIKVAGDMSWCDNCELAWDTNDSNPPLCLRGHGRVA